MKAIITHAPHNLQVEEFPQPVCNPGEVIIKIKGCGICAGDIKSYHGGIRIWGTSEADRYIEPPCIPGHEFYGEIVEIADDVNGFLLGDHILAEQILPCGECHFCKQGKHWLCTRSAVFGFKQYANGGFAEYARIPKNAIMHKLPSTFTQEESILVEPISCGMHALEQAKIKHNDIVVIAGLGAIGISMCNIANMAMPKLVIGIEVRENRIQLAKEYGADYVFNPISDDIKEKILELTDGLGCDVYIEASGNVNSAKTGLDVLKNGGRYVQLGVLSDLVTADWNIIGDGKELQIIGSHLSGKVYPAVIRGIEKGIIKTKGLISHKYKLDDVLEAYETAEKDLHAIKVILEP